MKKAIVVLFLVLNVLSCREDASERYVDAIVGNVEFGELVKRLCAIDYVSEKNGEGGVLLNVSDREQVALIKSEMEKLLGCKVVAIYQSVGDGYRHIVVRFSWGTMVVDGSREFRNSEYGGRVIRRVDDMQFSKSLRD